MKPLYRNKLDEFGITILVYYCSQRSVLAELTQLLEHPKEMAEVTTNVISAEACFIRVLDLAVIWIDSGLKTSKEVLNALVHESHHLSSAVNLEFSLDSEEYQAFLEGETVSTVFPLLQKKLTK